MYRDELAPTKREIADFIRQAVMRSRDIAGPAAPLVPFADWDFYFVDRTLEWTRREPITNAVNDVKVPKGFVTDLASVPRPFWSLLPRQGRYTYPAVLHDYLYWQQTCTRAQADDVLEAAMEELQVPAPQASTILIAVRMFGGGAWDNNADLKATGERRLLKLFPPDISTTWKIWKQQDVFE
ncbi:hypothetical protein FHT80_002088 [Rhizobium sp. BK226]|uniref:DUF1353 domain-containing protein n=1 Tax=Rhizobium sp. BK226 TaxID=2587075 RepID=UPI0018358C5C|nr:DUF1353 domain-containing protein [Rhizobium sp. BK226]MBB4112769.1 hypothetical protein [Rhizobium sp. BK226]